MKYIVGLNGSLHDSLYLCSTERPKPSNTFIPKNAYSGVPHHYGFPDAGMTNFYPKKQSEIN